MSGRPLPPPLAGLTTLTAAEAAELDALFATATMAAGTVVFDEGSPAPAFYVVRSGRVELVRRDEHGETRAVDYLVPGDFFGEMALLDGAGASATARVAETAELVYVARGDFERLTQTRPRLAMKVLAFVSRKLEQPDRLAAFRFTPEAVRANRVVAVSAPTAGQGATFVAANLARALAEEAPADEDRPVVLLELDAPYGNAALHLGCEGGRGWGGLLADLERGEDVDPLAHAVEAAPGLLLMAAPVDPELAATLAPGVLARLVQVVRERASRVVVDLPPGCGDAVRSVLPLADLTLLVSTCALDAVERLRRHLRAFDGFSGFPRTFPVVLNRCGSSADVHLPEREIMAARVAARLPNTAAAARSVGEGGCWLDSHPRTSLARALRELALVVTGDDDSLTEGAAFLWSWLPFHEPHHGRPPVPAPPLVAAPFMRHQRGRARLALGEALFLGGRHFEAFQELRRAVDDDPTLAPAYAMLAETALILGRRAEALTYFEAALRVAPDDLRSITGLALVHGDRELLERAATRLTVAVAEHGDWPDLHYHLGRVEVARGDARRAVARLTEALRLNPRYGAAYRALGDLYVAQGKNSQAVELYLQGLASQPGDLLGWMALGRLYKGLGLVAAAAEAYGQVVARCPHHGPAQAELMSLRETLEAVDDEIRTLEAALRINPDFSDTLQALGQAQLKRGLFDGAVSSFKRALRFNPDLMAAKEGLLRIRALRERMDRGRPGGGSPPGP